MSAYSGTPTIIASNEVGDRTGKFIHARKKMSIVLVAQGGGTNTISAASLGFAKLHDVICTYFVDGSLNKRVVNLFTDGDYLYIADPQVATDANRGLAADVTGTLYFDAIGRPT